MKVQVYQQVNGFGLLTIYLLKTSSEMTLNLAAGYG